MELKELQEKILEIAVYLDEFCRAHDITYYLMGGSALGAIRHKGFIPWDDDFDVFMTYDNYMKFLDAARKDLDTQRFYLQEENTPEWPLFFTKLRMNGTEWLEEDTKDREMHHGIFIDIMCLNNRAESRISALLQHFFAKLLIARTLSDRGYQSASFKKKVLMAIARVLVPRWMKKSLIGYVRRWNTQTTKEVAHYFGKAKYNQTSFPTYFLGKPRYVQFEQVELPVPAYCECYLYVRYGEFMKLPPQAEQKMGHGISNKTEEIA